MPPALMLALTASTRCLKPNALLVPLNAPLAQDFPTTVPHVFMDQSPLMAAALPCAVRTSTASKDSALLAQSVAMDARTPLKAASTVLRDT